MATIWTDIKSPSDAHFISAIQRNLQEHGFITTVRDRAESIGLAHQYALDAIAIGRDDHRRALKVMNYFVRVPQLWRILPSWDISINFNNMNANALAQMTRRPSITFMDNDLDFRVNRRALSKRGERFFNLRASRIFCPSVFPISEMVRLGAQRDHIIEFDGYKEDVYLADFAPEPEFLKTLPFEDYVVVRPEARSAVYVNTAESIVPALLTHLTNQGLNVVYLPRVASDRQLVPQNIQNVFVPDAPPNGLQLCWHARAVLTGSGSLAREAACLGVTSVSFFPETLLAVDRKMVSDGLVVHSRDPREIARQVESNYSRRKPATSRSRSVRAAVVSKLDEVICELTPTSKGGD